jgi:hypothetical protein
MAVWPHYARRSALAHGKFLILKERAFGEIPEKRSPDEAPLSQKDRSRLSIEPA